MEARSEALFNGDEVDFERAQLPLAYQSGGVRFQPFLEATFRLVEMSNADSFRGSYRAPASGFSINEATGGATQAEIQSGLSVTVIDRTSLSPGLQAALRGDIHSSASRWQLCEEGFIGVDANGVALRHDLPLDVPVMSWPRGTANDLENQLLWGVTLGG